MPREEGGLLDEERKTDIFRLPPSSLRHIPDLRFLGESPRRAAINVTDREFDMMPALSHEQLLTAIELVCYFCTAVGVAMTFIFSAKT